MKKLVAMGIAVGLVAGCTNNVEYTFGDRVRVRIQRSQDDDDRGVFEIRARIQERCNERQAKLAFAFHGHSPLGLVFKGSTPRVSCAT